MVEQLWELLIVGLLESAFQNYFGMSVLTQTRVEGRSLPPPCLVGALPSQARRGCRGEAISFGLELHARDRLEQFCEIDEDLARRFEGSLDPVKIYASS